MVVIFIAYNWCIGATIKTNNMAQQELKHKAWLIFPLLAFGINEDNSKEILFGWLNKTWTIKW